jgi:hypothetical protein
MRVGGSPRSGMPLVQASELFGPRPLCVCGTAVALLAQHFDVHGCKLNLDMLRARRAVYYSTSTAMFQSEWGSESSICLTRLLSRYTIQLQWIDLIKLGIVLLFCTNFSEFPAWS